MQLTPRYDGPPILDMDGAPSEVAEPLVRQRRRLAAALAELTDDQWQHASRCEAWTVQDVVSHLIGTNTFWSASIAGGLAGTPTQYLAAFDPVSTPASMVGAMRTMSAREVLDRFVETSEAMFALVADLDDAGWTTNVEAPPDVSMHSLALHALWDSWVHERDVLLPLGQAPTEAPDEVAMCLRYVAALGPILLAQSGTTTHGSFSIHATDPEVAVTVTTGTTVRVSGDVGDGPVVRGRAVDLIEMLSIRAPFTIDLPDECRWLFAGLARAFDQDVLTR